MRILIATRRYWPLVGGAEVVLRHLAAALVRRRHDVTVVTQLGPPTEATTDDDPGTDVVRLHAPTRRLIGTYLYMKRLGQWLRRHRERFDLCYTSMLKETAHVTVAVGRRLGLPVVLRPECSGRAGDIHWQRTNRFGRLIARQCRRAAGFVAISAAIHRELVQAGYPEDRIADIPNGVPIPDPIQDEDRPGWRARLGLSPAPTAVFTGRLAPQKNLGILVAAWPRLLARVPGAQLILVGDGPEAARLRRLIQQAGLEAHCRLVGQQADVTPYLRAADVFVLPSHDEGMSIALLEAMALGLPVVASHIEANRALVEPGRTGALVPGDDPAAWADHLAGVLLAPAEARRCAQAARAQVMDRWSVDRMADEHIAYFERLIGARACRAD